MKAEINIGDKVRFNDEYDTAAIVEHIKGDCLTVKCQDRYDFWSTHDVTVVQTKEDIELNNDKEMKLKDLLKGRDKLREYDELKAWRCNFAGMVDIPTWNIMMCAARTDNVIALPLPDHIKQIIIDALDAEIKKMEEE